MRPTEATEVPHLRTPEMIKPAGLIQTGGLLLHKVSTRKTAETNSSHGRTQGEGTTN